MVSSEFLLTSLIIVLIPGTGTLYTVSTGLFHGRRASVAAAIGCTVGILPHLFASILGLSFVFHMSATVFEGLKLVGALYLLYLAWTMWREQGTFTFTSTALERSVWQIIMKAVVLNLLNPKLTLFFFAFLPLSVPHGVASPLARLALLSVVFMAITLVVFVLYSVLASGVRTYVVSSPNIVTWLRRSFAATFAALGVSLALTNRYKVSFDPCSFNAREYVTLFWRGGSCRGGGSIGTEPTREGMKWLLAIGAS